MQLFVTSIAFFCNSVAASIRADFKSAEITPSILKTAPAHMLSASFNDKVVHFNQELTPRQVKDPPTTLSWPSKSSDFHTVSIIGPDIPSRQEPTRSQVLFWMVVNVPGNDISAGDTLVDYVPADPFKDTGMHRYILVVYKQPGVIDVANEKRVPNNSVEGRPYFSMQKFVEKYRLGPCAAANMFQAQWDDYVPTIHKQLNI